MLRCAWCMKKIRDDRPVLGISVQFADGIDFSESQGEVIQIGIHSRNTSVPMIVPADESEAKLQGTDAIFAMCSEKCANKMKETLTKELNTFKGCNDISLQ